MTRTLLVCSPTASIAGGVQTWLRELCAGLDHRRWRPLVALLRGARAHDAAAYQAAWPELETVEIDGSGLPATERIRAVARCVKRVRPHVFLPLTAVDAHYAACALKAGRTGVRYLLHVPGNMPPQIADARRCAPWADFLVAPSRLTCRLLERSGIPADRIRYVPYGAMAPVGPRRPRPQGAPLRLGYVGRLDSIQKRVADLVPLTTELERRGFAYSLTVAGDGAERGPLERAIGRYPRVRFLGRLDTRELYERVYPDLDVLFLFSEAEGSPIVTLEAMLHGVVPVTSCFLGLGAEGILRDEETALLFPIADTTSAASCIERLVAAPELLARLSAAARAAVERRYTWAACVAGWTEALDELMEVPLREGSRLPEVPQPSSGRLDRLGLPLALKDLLRRVRRHMFGVPEALKGGEEWPWVDPGHEADILAEIAETARRLDHRET